LCHCQGVSVGGCVLLLEILSILLPWWSRLDNSVQSRSLKTVIVSPDEAPLTGKSKAFFVLGVAVSIRWTAWLVSNDSGSVPEPYHLLIYIVEVSFQLGKTEAQRPHSGHQVGGAKLALGQEEEVTGSCR
jgi:hypothetical protein